MSSLFLILLSFSESLAIKCLFLNDESFKVRPTNIDLNLVELKYYPFIIGLDKCSGICNVLSPKICVPKEIKDINVKAFNMITNKNETNTTAEHISCDCKCKFNSTTCNSKHLESELLSIGIVLVKVILKIGRVKYLLLIVF